MSAVIVARSETSFIVQVEVPYASSMLDFEQAIQDRLNQAGVVATQEALQQFDTDGKPITIGPVKFTSKGPLPKEYQTPYGVATVSRHVYQSPQGGKTYCPLDREARIVTSSTPRFAKMIAHKYAEFGSGRVTIDLEENHGRKVARSFIQNVADAVAAVALAKEESWAYALPEMEQPVRTVTLGLDGTCLLMCEDGWRETMVGTIGFYDKAGERQHTTYMAATPEYGKATFLVPGPHGAGDRAGEGVVPARPLRRHRRRGGGQLGLPRAAHRGPGGGLLACGGVPGQGRSGAAPGPPGNPPEVDGRQLPYAEARSRRCRGGAEAVEVAVEGTSVGQARRGRAAGDHVLCEPVGCGPDGLPDTGASQRADRQRGDGGGVQGAGEAAAVRVGDEVEGAGGGGGVERAMPDVHDGALVAVLGQDRPIRIPGCCMKQGSEVT